MPEQVVTAGLDRPALVSSSLMMPKGVSWV